VKILSYGFRDALNDCGRAAENLNLFDGEILKPFGKSRDSASAALLQQLCASRCGFQAHGTTVFGIASPFHQTLLFKTGDNLRHG
jgi:hypothetical protein